MNNNERCCQRQHRLELYACIECKWFFHELRLLLNGFKMRHSIKLVINNNGKRIGLPQELKDQVF